MFISQKKGWKEIYQYIKNGDLWLVGLEVTYFLYIFSQIFQDSSHKYNYFCLKNYMCYFLKKEWPFYHSHFSNLQRYLFFFSFYANSQFGCLCRLVAGMEITFQIKILNALWNILNEFWKKKLHLSQNKHSDFCVVILNNNNLITEIKRKLPQSSNW